MSTMEERAWDIASTFAPADQARAELFDAILAALREAKAEGAREMREAAAEVADSTRRRAFAMPDWCAAAAEIAARCGADDREGAERELALYIARKHKPKGARHPSRVPVADVLRYYGTEVAPKHARPIETLSRIEALIEHFAGKTCEAINGAECRAFASKRTPASARRALEDLRAALHFYHSEGFIEAKLGVALPEKQRSRERWLTRKEAARLLWAAYRAREVQKGATTARRPGKHVARFVLIGLYTGTRAGAITGATWKQIDLASGVFHRMKDGDRLTKKRKPPVKLAPRLLAHLRRWRAMEPDAKYVVEWRGEPVLRVRTGFAAAAKAAKLKGVTPHVLRHTAATWLMQQGVDDWEAAGFLGMTVETLREVYGHHHPEFQGQAAEAVGRKRKTA